ncbi:MAG: ROK family protein [Planctomycetaceae bacterium]|nr:ROK family protein [Planctomycetaceae bacterium]
MKRPDATAVQKIWQAASPSVVPNLLRRMNERRLIEAVQAKGPLSRAALVRHTGISPPTVSKLVQSLIQARLLEEVEPQSGSAGRPAKLLRLAGKGVCIVAAVVDLKQCSLAAAGLDGTLREDRVVRFPTPDDYAQLLQTLVDHVRQLASAENAATLALGLCIPGLIDRRRQRVLLSANLHLLDGQRPAADLQRRLNIPVVLLHETDALCLGQRAFGPARGLDDLVLIDAAGGLGMAVMIGGQLLAGYRGLAGEIGHLTVEPHGRPCGCGNVGCLETVASDATLAERVSQRIGQTVNIDQVVEMVRRGTLQVDAELNQTLDYLAIGVAGAVNIFNPAAVLIHGRMFDLCDDAFDRLRASVARRALTPSLAECRILRASGGKLQSAVAATISHLTSVLGPKV